MKKLQRDEKVIHTQASTTFKLDAGTKKYHCLFFCQRRVDSDVVDPRDTKSGDLKNDTRRIEQSSANLSSCVS